MGNIHVKKGAFFNLLALTELKKKGQKRTNMQLKATFFLNRKKNKKYIEETFLST